jgi:excisionase family DNA binding protein
MTTSQLLTEKEAAQRLGLSVSTLQQRRFRGRLPAFVKLGKAVRYRPEDLDAFIEQNRIAPNAAAV